MSERSEYIREKKIFEDKLGDTATALAELGDTWAAQFVDSLKRQIERQGVGSWGPSLKQDEILDKIKVQYGELLYDAAKRKDLIHRREMFMERFKNLQKVAESEKDEWLINFLGNTERWIAKGISLSSKQKDTLQKSFRKYKIASERYSYDHRL